MSDMTATLLSMFRAFHLQNGHGDLAEKLILVPGISLSLIKGNKDGVTPSSAAAQVTRTV